MTDPFAYLLLILAGIVAGTLNVIAGGGSFLTLPILIFLGFPAITANGTNRVGILLQNVGAVWRFHRYKVVTWRSLLWAALPAAAGSIFGVWIAFEVGDAAFQRILAALMVMLTLWTLWDPLKKRSAETSDIETSLDDVGGPLVFLAFFCVGIYGGFVQAGVGFLVLAVTTMAGIDLVRGNAVKVLCILVFVLLSLALFAWNGQVEWLPGIALGIGTTIGGQIGAHLTVLKGHSWIKTVVTATVLIFALKLWFMP